MGSINILFISYGIYHEISGYNGPTEPLPIMKCGFFNIRGDFFGVLQAMIGYQPPFLSWSHGEFSMRL